MSGTLSERSLTRALYRGPLDLAGVQAGGWSMRRLLLAAGAPWLRVRRSSGGEVDIGWTADGWGDVAALLAFVGAGSGFVRRLYGQGQGVPDAVQDTQSAQPTIVASGALVTSPSGRPSIVAPTTAQFMTITGGALLGTTGAVLPENWVTLVGRADGAVGHSFVSNDVPSKFGHAVGTNLNGSYYSLSGRYFYSNGAAGSLPHSAFAVVSTEWSTTKGNAGFVNGAQVMTGINDNGDAGGSDIYLFAFQPASRGSNVPIYLSEVIIGKSRRSALQRQMIERSAGAAFGIAVA